MTESLSIVHEAQAVLKKKKRSTSLDRAARKIMLAMFRKISTGRLILAEGEREYGFGRVCDALPTPVRLQVHHPKFYTRTVFGGSIGAGEAHMAGLWSTDQLAGLIRLMLINQRSYRSLESGWAWLSAPFYRFYHFLRRNTPSGSRRNIVAHYDLGNDFYQLFLDETMTYSAGIFASGQSSLKQASLVKYDHICKKLNIGPDDHVVEIGTGWGGFAKHAAGRYGCRVTTTTISDEQYRWAGRQVRTAGLQDRITLLKQDYRSLTGQFDKLVSIEMIEAVGHQYLATFFQTCSRLLKDGGRMLLQAITIKDQFYHRHKYSVDFIKRYIFPGSCIPSISAMNGAAADKADLRLVHLEDITPHYVTTLQQWRRRFFDNIQRVRRMGYPETFIRMWEFYLCYCEAGFAERHIGNAQLIFDKPMCREPAPLMI